MATTPNDALENDGYVSQFDATRWTLVLRARGTDSIEAQEALGILYKSYWYPLYFYARRRGLSKEDAEDRTQGFFERLIEKRYLDDVSAEKGRFRAFILHAFKYFMAEDWKRANAEKRGGGVAFVPIPMDDADIRFSNEQVSSGGPEIGFDKSWAHALLDQARARLKEEKAAEGKSSYYEALLAYLPTGQSNGQSLGYSVLAVQLGLSEEGARTVVHRFRKRYAQIVRNEVANTLANPAEVEDELSYLIRVLES